MSPDPTKSTLFPYTTLFRSRMAERWRQMFRPATISLIRSQNVESDLVRPLGNSQHVRRFARTFKAMRSEEHTSELQSLTNLVCRLLLEKKKTIDKNKI